MKTPPLTDEEVELIRKVLRQYPEVATATLFGSRAKGTHTERSDVDLAVAGIVAPLVAEAIAAELDELPLPYRFEVQSIEHILHRPLVEHIRRVGIVIFRHRGQDELGPSSWAEVLTPDPPPSPAR